MEDKSSGTVIRVMVIDDVKIICNMVKDTLKDAGYVVCTFVDPVKALEIIPKWKPDVVVLDFAMENLSGIDALKFIRTLEEEYNLNIAVIGLSGSHPEAEVLFMENSADAYLDKPFRRSPLVRTIERVYWKRRNKNAP